MVLKHNNQLPNAHLRKQWQRRVRTTLDQAGAKKRRREARQLKAIRVAPRPVDGLLRPAVRGQTFKYNSKLRAGRGFTFEELKAAKIGRKEARTIGVSVDFRRRNRSEESLKLNIERLEAYKAKLLVFPRNSKKPKHGDASADQLKNAKQVRLRDVFPINSSANKEVEARAITAEEKEFDAYTASRQAWVKAKYAGRMKKRAAEKAAAEAEKKG